MTRAVPVAGIMFGQKGYCGNVHYSDVEVARVAFDARCADVRKAYSTPGRQWTGNFVEEEIPAHEDSLGKGNHYLGGRRFTNLKKNGKKGAVVHTVSLYAIGPEQAARFMSDPWYACS